MKILTLSNYYPPSFKGAYEILCKMTLDELARRGHEVHVLVGNEGAGERKPKDACRKEDNIYRLLHLYFFDNLDRPHRVIRQLRKAYASRLDYRVAQRIGAVIQPDLIYVWNMCGLSMAVLAALNKLGASLVFDIHDYWLLERDRDLAQETNRFIKAYRSTVEGCPGFEAIDRQHIMTTTQSLKREYVKAGFAKDDITVIRRGIPSQYVQDRPTPRDAASPNLRLLFAGRLVKEKGILVALQALSLLAHTNLSKKIRLDIAGSGPEPYVKQLEHEAVNLGLSQVVQFLGPLEHDRLIASYEGYDAVLFPSLWVEPFGVVVLEAMARGTCVIASDLGGPSEIITHEKDGLLVRPNDPEALAQAVLRLARTPALVEELGQAAIQTIRQRFIFEKTVDPVEEYLATAVKGKKNDPKSL